MSPSFHFCFLSLLPFFLAASPMQSARTWVHQAKHFYGEVRTEMNYVTWPDRREVARTTVIVIIVIFAFGIYLFIADELSSRAIGWIMRRFGVTH